MIRALCLWSFLCGSLPLMAQIGCAYPGPCTNPVPVDNVTGAWRDSSSTWYVTSNGTTVTGTVIVNPVVNGCPSVYYSLTGTITPSWQFDYVQGSTAFNWTASGPSPSSTPGCPPPYSQMNYAGTIQNNGNDRGTGTWSRTGASGSFTLNKTADAPSTETTIGVGFGPGLYATIGQFRQILTGSSDGPSHNIFRGRQVLEQNGTVGPHYDTCYFSGSTVPQFTSVTGSTWNVGYYQSLGNYWIDDYIGWNTSQVTYYRQHWPADPSSGLVCSARLPQAMFIKTSNGLYWYKNNDLWQRIFSTYVTVQRDTVTQTANY